MGILLVLFLRVRCGHKVTALNDNKAILKQRNPVVGRQGIKIPFDPTNRTVTRKQGSTHQFHF